MHKGKERKDKSMKHKIKRKRERRDQSEALTIHRPCNKIWLLVCLSQTGSNGWRRMS